MWWAEIFHSKEGKNNNHKKLERPIYSFITYVAIVYRVNNKTYTWQVLKFIYSGKLLTLTTFIRHLMKMAVQYFVLTTY